PGRPLDRGPDLIKGSRGRRLLWTHDAARNICRATWARLPGRPTEFAERAGRTPRGRRRRSTQELARDDRARTAATNRPHLRPLARPEIGLLLRVRLLPARQSSQSARRTPQRSQRIRTERRRFAPDHRESRVVPAIGENAGWFLWRSNGTPGHQ